MSELDDLVRNRRFDEIHEARRQVIEDERAIDEAVATGQVADDQARRLYQRAVGRYVRELEHLLNGEGDSEESKHWSETQIGEIALPGDNDPVVVTGLSEFLDLSEVITAEVTQVTKESYDEVGTTTTATVTVQPSWELLRSAFAVADAARAELGLELDTSEEQEAAFDYSDLLDEPAPNDRSTTGGVQADDD